MGHFDQGIFTLIFSRSAMGGGEGGVVDVAARQDEAGQAVIINISLGRIVRKHRLPDGLSLGHAGERKFDDIAGTP